MSKYIIIDNKSNAVVASFKTEYNAKKWILGYKLYLKTDNEVSPKEKKQFVNLLKIYKRIE